jgi:hypothetical protein
VVALKSRRLFAAVVLAVLAALVLALPAISVTRTQDTTTSEPRNTEETTGETTSVPPDEDPNAPCPQDETPLASLRARLTGAEEVPGPGDPNASGRATVAVFSGAVDYRLRFEGIGEEPAPADEPATAAHIHVGERGEAGPVLVPLFNTPVENHSSGCVKVPRAVSRLLSENPPSLFYVNVHHSEEFPEGAIRGQLRERR